MLYEDEKILVLNKESGIPSVPHSPSETESAVGSALAAFPALCDVGFGGLEPGLLHRLDTGTSGVLVFAKTSDEFRFLRSAWQNGQVRKIYRARVCCKDADAPGPEIQELRFLMAHDEKSTKRMVAFPEGIRAGSRYRGKPMETVTRITKIHSIRENVTDLEIEIETGVMHQIRCTLSALSWPILGDCIYGARPSSRLWLHAWKLELPRSHGSVLKLEAPLPQDWDLRQASII